MGTQKTDLQEVMTRPGEQAKLIGCGWRCQKRREGEISDKDKLDNERESLPKSEGLQRQKKAAVS